VRSCGGSEQSSSGHPILRFRGSPDSLLTTTLIGAGWEGEDLRALTTRLEEAAAAFDRGDAGVLVRALTPPGQAAPTDEQIAAANASLFARNEPKVLGAVMRGMIQINEISSDELRANKVPTLALVGERDRRVPDVKRLAGVMSNLEVVVLPGATHATSVGMSTGNVVSFLGRHGSK
jgi:pimeloyl-ACP methyl ester carboxylesterase